MSHISKEKTSNLQEKLNIPASFCLPLTVSYHLKRNKTIPQNIFSLQPNSDDELMEKIKNENNEQYKKNIHRIMSESNFSNHEITSIAPQLNPN